MVFRFIIILISITFSSFANSLPQPYNTAMVENSQKYIDYAFLANRVYDENTSNIGKTKTIFGKSWELYWYQSEKSGFQGAVYRHYGEWVVAIGGTTASPSNMSKIQKLGEDGRDILTDLRLVSNLVPTSQADDVLKFIQDIKDDGVNIDAIVGHSLGGGLAAYAGLYYNIKTVTFNTSPIPFTKKSIDSFLKNYSITLPYGSLKWGKKFAISYVHSDKIINIMSANDPLTHFLNIPLIDWDNKAFNASNPLTTLNTLKGIMLIPIQMKLNYIMTGKNIQLDIDTGHSIAKMLEKMKEAKYIDDYNNYINKWSSLIDKVKALRENNIQISYSFYKDGKLNINFPNENAMRYYAIRDIRTIYNKNAKLLNLYNNENLKIYKNNDSFIEGLSLKDEVKTDDFTNSTKYISYREYMKVASATYKKLFGNVFFLRRYIKSKNKSFYKVYDNHFKKYAKDDVKILYRNIFLLHFIGGIPKKYLQNDNQNISNGFLTRFVYRFFYNVIKYRNLKLKDVR